MENKPFIHPTACVEEGAKIGANSKVWHFCHVRAGSVIEENCSLGKDSYLDSKVKIGRNTRIQNGVSLFNGVDVAEFVFIGPHVVFTNDLYPRAGAKNWAIIPTYLRAGAALGAGSVIRCGITLGEFSMVAAGAVVTKDIPPFTLVMGVPAQVVKRICACGKSQFDLQNPEWRAVLPCCEDSLVSEMIDLAKTCAAKL